MEKLIEKLNENKDCLFCQNINESIFIQNVKMNNGENISINNIVDLILMKYNPILGFGEIDKIKIEKEKINMMDNLYTDYDNYNFNNRVLSIKKIHNGFQTENSLSAIYFLSEYYKRNFCILCDDNILVSNYKDYEKDYLSYKNDKYSFIDEFNIKNEKNIYESNIFNNDVISENIYKTDLNSISKYKLSELKEIAKGYEIQSDNLNKKDLYLELYKLNLNNIDN